MDAAQNKESTLIVNYRCDKIINHNLEILWSGPSKKFVLDIETEPWDFLLDPLLMESMKKQIVDSLKQQPFVQAFLPEGGSICMANCMILYKDNNSWCPGLTEMDLDNLSLNQPIDISEDEWGPYAELWISLSLAVHPELNA